MKCTMSFVFIAALVAGLPWAQAGMMTTFQASGQLGYELAGVASPGPPVNSTITLSSIPPGAMIQQVFVYTNDFVSGGGFLDITITPPVGPAVGATSVSPSSSDPVPIAQTFGYKIQIPPTSIIGNGNYGVNIQPSFLGGNANQIAGAAMLVIYSDPMLPQSTITLNDGVFMMGPGGQPNSNTTTFQQQTDTIHGSAGSQLSILTFADDFPSGTNEKIVFNGSTVGGPIDANLPGGGSASIFNLSVTSTSGSTNAASVTSTGDIFGWHVAVLQTPVPEPASCSLALVSLLALLVVGRLRRK
jgi:hypothetical protein